MAEETGQKQSKIQNLLELLQKTFLTVRDTINNQVKKHISLPDLQIGLEDEKYPPRGIIFPSRTAPTTSTNKLYNENGILRFDGKRLWEGWTNIGEDVAYESGSVGPQVGIGIYTPDNNESVSRAPDPLFMLDIQRDGWSDQEPPAGQANPAGQAHIGLTQFADGGAAGSTPPAVLMFRRAGGAASNPTPIQEDDKLGDIVWRGYDNGGSPLDNPPYLDGWGRAAMIRCKAAALFTGGDTSAHLLFYTTPPTDNSPDERLRITSAGDVGIGATDPVSLLEVRGDTSAPGAVLTISTADTTIIDGNVLGRINFQAPKEAGEGDAILAAASIWAEADGTFTVSSNKTDLVFATGNSEAAVEKMRITSAGDVGIGTTGPDRKLDILDASNPQLRLTHTDGSKFVDLKVDTNHDLTVTPSSTGQIKLQPTTDSVDFFQVLDADGGTPVLNVDSTNERVGIGTASPSAKLEVAGDVEVLNQSVFRRSSGRYYLEEFYKRLPEAEAPTTVSQATSITTTVTSNSKYTIITTQAGVVVASAWSEFTFTNRYITATSIVLAVVQDTSDGVTANIKALVQVSGVTAGSCKIRLINPDAGATTSQVYKIAVIVDPHMNANQNFAVAGTNGDSVGIKYTGSYAAITLETGTSDNDQVIIQPRTNTSQELGIDDAPSAWSGVNWGTENQVEWECAVLSAAITNRGYWAGLKLTNTSTIATDADQAYFTWCSNDDFGTLADNANWHFVYSRSGTGTVYITDLGLAIQASTIYRLRISIDSSRQVSVFINDTQYGLTHSAGTTGTTESDSTKKSLALTDNKDLIPYVGVQTVTTSAAYLYLCYQKISRILHE